MVRSVIARRVRRWVWVAAAVAGLGAAGALTPAAAATVSHPGATSHTVKPEKITHPNRDYMGWELRGTEPHTITPDTVTANVSGLPGIDVSSWQGDVDWSAAKADGIDFVYTKATEGTYYQNPYFSQQYEGAYDEGIIRGAYHFAIPNDSSGATQADYFAENGGGWSPDGLTLPGLLDIEYNPYGDECYDLSQSAMVDWIADFLNEYHADTGTWAVIYTTLDWWTTCTGNYGGFADNDPLDIANYNTGSYPALPAGWTFYTFWQYGDDGTFGDEDVFSASYSQLQKLATVG